MALPRKAPPPPGNDTSVLAETGRWRDASEREHFEALVQVCRLAALVLEHRAQAPSEWDAPDPLPRDSVALIERLRRPWRERWRRRA